MLYSELFNNSLRKFKDNAEEKRLEIEILLREAFNLSKTGYWTRKNEVITDKNALSRFYRWRSRLFKGEPLAYITGEKESFSRNFYLNRHVLIPRPETEILIEEAIASLKEKKNPVEVLDIGTGSGIIAINVALETAARVAALDKSRPALQVLKKNLVLHNLRDKVIPVCADLFPLRNKYKRGPFDLIVSNPPYVSEAEWEELPVSIKHYEPKVALVAAEDGLAIIRRIAGGAKDYLKPGGRIMLEIGHGQSKKVAEILREAGFFKVEFVDDYNNIPRVASAVI
ncbi:MAG: peptide chain release factor N(5)-glutamine methyltransferase [Candidatus Aminicenantes bacterium]|nr:peptide chain release factor N(5)-glutamine methyltransferase [Candidatus Aminicenantes bacterium]